MNLVNGNVFLVDASMYSTFRRAEEVLLSQIRSLSPCGFLHTIKCVQINTNTTKETQYHGSVEIKDGFKHIIIKRDEKNKNGCKKTHREKIRSNLDY